MGKSSSLNYFRPYLHPFSSFRIIAFHMKYSFNLRKKPIFKTYDSKQIS